MNRKRANVQVRTQRQIDSDIAEWVRHISETISDHNNHYVVLKYTESNRQLVFVVSPEYEGPEPSFFRKVIGTREGFMQHRPKIVGVREVKLYVFIGNKQQNPPITRKFRSTTSSTFSSSDRIATQILKILKPYRAVRKGSEWEFHLPTYSKQKPVSFRLPMKGTTTKYRNIKFSG
jgi:hypothetical protein